MTASQALERGRQAFRQRAWADAYRHLAAAQEEALLELADLERLAIAAHLVGKDELGADLWAHAHQEFLREGDASGATRCAFWLGFTLVNRGEHARGGGWFARARRVLDESGQDCVESGYLLLPQAMRAIGERDLDTAHQRFTQAADVGERFSDTGLVTLARHGQGRVLIRMGKVARGVALLDEAMVVVTSGELPSLIAGNIYCSVLEACQEISDPRRAREWTEAMTRWMEAQPDLVPYRGQCLVHRSELMQWCGRWEEALEEAKRASELLTRPPPQPAAGAAFYRLGELYRLRGDFKRAEECYREAHRWGRRPEPGLPLLRLVQGNSKAAKTAIERAVHEARDPWTQASLLPACVSILLEAGDTAGARTALEALSGLCDVFESEPMRAEGATGRGAILLAEGEAEAALPFLRLAGDTFRKLDAPYETARVGVLMGRACRALGDADAAELELDAARRTFQRLGAIPDLRRVDRLSGVRRSGGATDLTPRQAEVLRLVATGKTNKAIAAELFISERTVERHLSNIFTRLGLSSRAEATAYAYQHDLV